jgi:mRNA-degrading endonuclease toxin of MazEF toxin-antitoxin module
MVKIKPNIENGLVKTSSIDCFQIRSVSEKRLVKQLGLQPWSLLRKALIRAAKPS